MAFDKKKLRNDPTRDKKKMTAAKRKIEYKHMVAEVRAKAKLELQAKDQYFVDEEERISQETLAQQAIEEESRTTRIRKEKELGDRKSKATAPVPDAGPTGSPSNTSAKQSQLRGTVNNSVPCSSTRKSSKPRSNEREKGGIEMLLDKQNQMQEDLLSLIDTFGKCMKVIGKVLCCDCILLNIVIFLTCFRVKVNTRRSWPRNWLT